MTRLPLYANIILTIVGAIIAFSNATACFAFYADRKLRTITNHFVISLAVSDFLIGSVLAPMSAWNDTSSALGPLIAFTLIGSLSNICGCTYDRYIAIYHPLRCQAILTKTKLYKVLLIIWIVPLVVAIIPQLWMNLSDQLGLSVSAIIMTNRVYVGLMAFGVLATCIVLIIIYFGIFRVARKHFDAISYLDSYNQPRPTQNESNGARARRARRFSLKSLVKDVKATKLFAIIATTFLLCWLPLIIINITDSLGYGDKVPIEFVNVALFTMFCNSLVDPIIYAFFQPSFRRVIASWFLCEKMRKKREEFYNGGREKQKLFENNKKQNGENKRRGAKLSYEFQSRQEESAPAEALAIIETNMNN